MNEDKEVKFETLAEVEERVKEKTKKVKLQNIRIGKWKLNWKDLTLEHNDNYGYYVDLERCTTSAQVLDWIFHINQKKWCKEQDLFDLIQIIDVVVRPCSNLCGFGVEKGPYKFWLRNDFLESVARRFACLKLDNE